MIRRITGISSSTEGCEVPHHFAGITPADGYLKATENAKVIGWKMTEDIGIGPISARWAQSSKERGDLTYDPALQLRDEIYRAADWRV